MFTINDREWRTDVVGVEGVIDPGGRKLDIASFVTTPDHPGTVRR